MRGGGSQEAGDCPASIHRVCSGRMTSMLNRDQLWPARKTRNHETLWSSSCLRAFVAIQVVLIRPGQATSGEYKRDCPCEVSITGGHRTSGLANRRPHAARASIGNARKDRSVLRPIVGGGFRRLHDIAAARGFQDFLSFLRPGFVVAMYRNQVSAFPYPTRKTLRFDFGDACAISTPPGRRSRRPLRLPRARRRPDRRLPAVRIPGIASAPMPTSQPSTPPTAAPAPAPVAIPSGAGRRQTFEQARSVAQPYQG